jgi:general secretion pathway protein C
MESFLRQYRWALHLGVITVAAFLIASIVNRVVASQLAPFTVPKTPEWTSTQQPSSEPSNRVTTADIRDWDKAISDRCLFGCANAEDEEKECPGGCDEGESCKDGVCVPDEPTSGQGQGSDVPTPSDLNITLLGSMVADNPQYSMALMQDGKSSQTFVVSVGDVLPSGATITRITRDRIFLRPEGSESLEFIRLDKTISGNPSPVSVRSKGRSTGPGPATREPRDLNAALRDLRRAAKADSSEKEDEGNNPLARRTDGNNYAVSRKKVSKALENPRNLVRQARMVPNYTSDGAQGLKMAGVSPNGFFDKLGFKTGDVLLEVNGKKLKSRSDASALIQEMRGNEDSVTVKVQRDGETVERNYNFQ